MVLTNEEVRRIAEGAKRMVDSRQRLWMLQAPSGHLTAIAAHEPGSLQQFATHGFKPVQVEVRILDDTA